MPYGQKPRPAGLCAVISARLPGAERVILMGRHTQRTDLGCEFGATGAVAGRRQNGVYTVRELIGGTEGERKDAASLLFRGGGHDGDEISGPAHEALADRADLAGHRGLARTVDHYRAQTGAEPADDVPFLLVPPRMRAQQEAPAPPSPPATGSTCASGNHGTCDQLSQPDLRPAGTPVSRVNPS